jgi:ABC-type lipoprotein export system ATPase subunit
MVTHDPDIAHYTKRIIHIRDGMIAKEIGYEIWRRDE